MPHGEGRELQSRLAPCPADPTATITNEKAVLPALTSPVSATSGGLRQIVGGQTNDHTGAVPAAPAGMRWSGT